MDYSDFLDTKRIVAKPSGISILPDEISPSLYEFQKDICLWALKLGRAAVFAGTGCVAGETRIDGTGKRIDELAKIGTPIKVWSLAPNGSRIKVQASAPFLKGRAALYEFQLSSGRKITVTGHHRFLTQKGWRHASTLAIGDGLAVSFRTMEDADAIPRDGYSPFLPQSIEGFSPSAQSANDRCCERTILNYQDRCSAYSYRDGGPLRPAGEIVVAFLPSRADVPAYTHAGLHVDAPAYAAKYIHPDRSSDRPSMMDSVCRDTSIGGDAGFLHASWLSKPRFPILQAGPQFSVSASLERLACELFQHQQELGGDQCGACDFSFDTVIAISYIRTDDYYDMRVPFFENYLANGVWNHNTGKTFIQVEWASHIPGRSLIVAPLCVAQQTIKLAKTKLGIDIREVATGAEMKDDEISITNYEKLKHFVGTPIDAIALDESSILKSIDGATRNLLLEQFTDIPYRLACTATPAPNDIAEMANHAEFLGHMKRTEMLAAFFVHDDEGWRLRGHAAKPFYRWLASWAMMFVSPADLGYDGSAFVLPPLEIRDEIIKTDWRRPGELFAGVGLKGITDRAHIRRVTTGDRGYRALEIIKNSAPDSQWLVWCGLNAEQHFLAKLLGDSCVSIEGATPEKEKIRLEALWRDGKVRVLLTKGKKLFGFGMNWQHCSNMIFYGMDDSWESYFQQLRRCWRYGQTKPVTAHIVVTDHEQQIVANVRAKEKVANETVQEVVKTMREYEIAGIRGTKETEKMTTCEYSGLGWRIQQGDCIELMGEMPENYVDLSVYSPPFLALYTYSASERDLGNAIDPDKFMEHYQFAVRQLLRITKPGRITAVHCAQITTTQVSDGVIGLRDFRGRLVEEYVKAGWVYHGEVCIDKDPQAQAIRTHSKGLLFVQLHRDASWLRPALADYILFFRKPGENAVPIHPDLTHEEWIQWARPIWYGISESDTLNKAEGRSEEDDRHICALQLQTIRQCVRLWSNPGELIFDPFCGIGSTGFVAIELGRKFVGCELKPLYARTAVKNLNRALAAKKQVELFA